jgi:hypothetical protein
MDSHYNNQNLKLDKLLSKQQHKRKTEHNQFYPRTVNLTNMKLTHEEISVLNKGLQYSSEKAIRKYRTDLILETELAIRKLDIKMQAAYRILASRKLNQIQASCSHYNTEVKRHYYVLKNLNNKLKKEDAMIVKADKGKSCIILYTSDYTKVENYLKNNNFQKLPKDPTEKYQKNITKVLQQYNLIVNKKQMHS